MRDDSRNWGPPPQPADRIAGDGVTGEWQSFDRLTLISGPVPDTLPRVGWPDMAPDGPYAVSLRRDRVLEVNGPARTDGWDEAARLAISTMTDGYAAVALHGARALDVLKRGAELSLDEPSASAARLFFGLPAILYRTHDAGFIAVFTRAQAAAGWLSLAHAVAALPPNPTLRG